MRIQFLTVTDAHFFPGTVATVNSVRCFHPEAEVCVVHNHVQRSPLTAAQRAAFEAAGVRIVEASALARAGRKLAAWELKAYGASDLTEGCDVLVGIDSDCVLCGRIDDVVAAAKESGTFHGGRDGTIRYDETYRPYGIEVPGQGPNMSTSLYVCANTAANRGVLQRWAECCDRAIFGGGKIFPGHGDQGVLNAVIYSERGPDGVRLLENRLWSQHHCYWQGHVTLREGHLFNEDIGGQQRSIHCGGGEKFWNSRHLEKLGEYPGLEPSYAWFLRHLWFGRVMIDPADLVPEHRHLIEALVRRRAMVAGLSAASCGRGKPIRMSAPQHIA